MKRHKIGLQKMVLNIKRHLANAEYLVIAGFFAQMLQEHPYQKQGSEGFEPSASLLLILDSSRPFDARFFAGKTEEKIYAQNDDFER